MYVFVTMPIPSLGFVFTGYGPLSRAPSLKQLVMTQSSRKIMHGLLSLMSRRRSCVDLQKDAEIENWNVINFLQGIAPRDLLWILALSNACSDKFVLQKPAAPIYVLICNDAYYELNQRVLKCPKQERSQRAFVSCIIWNIKCRNDLRLWRQWWKAWNVFWSGQFEIGIGIRKIW